MKVKIEQMKMRETKLEFASSLPYAYGRMCTIASPTKAPQPKEYSKFMSILKLYSLIHLRMQMMKMAARTPTMETPAPAKIPNPQA